MSWWMAGSSAPAARNWPWNWRQKDMPAWRKQPGRASRRSGKGVKMITMRQEKDLYLSSFSAFEERLASDERSPLHRLRRSAIERFATLGFPTLHDEEWRFTNIAPLLKVPFELGEAKFHSKEPERADGVLVCSLAEALVRYP